MAYGDYDPTTLCGYTYGNNVYNDNQTCGAYAANVTITGQNYTWIPVTSASASSNMYITTSAAATNVSYDYSVPWTQDITATTIDTQITWNVLTPKEIRRAKLKDKLIDHTVYKRAGIGKAINAAEEKSRESLKAIIGQERYRKYLKDGFVMVRSKSCKLYQIFPGHRMTEAKDNNITNEKLCVVFKDSKLPPTDVLIMRMMMILGDEEGFRKTANIFPPTPTQTYDTNPVQVAQAA